MNRDNAVRILVSRETAGRLEGEIKAAMGTHKFELVMAEQVRGSEPADIDIAFISRDVTGLSTKYVLTEPLEAFYASLRSSPNLRWVHTHSAGADRPIFPELKARGVKVTTSSGANAEVVAQTALAGVLALAREFPKLFDAQRNRVWSPLIGTALPRDLAGQHAVVVGWGPIARRIGSFLQMLGLKLTVVRNSAQSVGENIKTVVFSDFFQVLPQADWLILACPLSEQTRCLVDRNVFELLGSQARLINVARGEIVVEQDLIHALEAGQIAGAYLDVFEHEPLDAASPLWGFRNVLLTPHAAGHSDGNARRVEQIFIDYLNDWANSAANC